MATGELIYRTEEEYRADTSRVSQSMLKVFARSPYRYWCYFVGKTHQPPSPTPAMLKGIHLHSCVFEPGYLDRLCVAPRFDRRTKEGKASYADFWESNADKILVEGEVFDSLRGMVDRLRANQTARNLLWGEGPSEHAVIGECRDTGIPLKGRVDKLRTDIEVIPDLKTCSEPDEESFRSQATRLGYWQQGAFYQELVEQNTGKRMPFVFVCISPEPPYEIGMWEASERSLAFGRARNAILLRDLKRRMDANDWLDPGEREVVPIDPPAWAEKQLEYLGA